MSAPLSHTPRVVVVGAGPAGVRAAAALVDAGVRPIVVDEGMRDGGQIYRRQPDGFTRSYAKLYGSEADKAEALHRAFDALRSRVDYQPGTLVWNVTEGAVHAMRGIEAQTIRYDALIVCSGATDRLLPVPGWNLAGCYSLGAAQIALKAQACAIGSRVVFAGSGPLLYLVASQYIDAGGRVEAVLDTSPALPSPGALAAMLSRPDVVFRGLRFINTLRKRGVVRRNNVKLVAIDGDHDDGVCGITYRDDIGVDQRIECDAVALGWHLRAETQLADLADCAFDFEPETRQWLPRIDADGRSTQPRVYLAGDGARILGADGAEASGRLAALAALRDLDHAAGRALFDAEAPSLHKALVRFASFRSGLARAFPWPHAHVSALPDTAVVCRCEAITAGELRHAVNDLESREINRAKAFTRVGMGRCQGRYCGHAAAEVMAHAAQLPIESVGRLRSQAPVKPLLMDSLEAKS